MSKDSLMAAVAAAAGAEDQKPVTVTADLIKTHFPEVAAKLVAEGRESGLKDGAKAESERIASIDAVTLPGHEKLAAEYKKDAGKTKGDFLEAQVAAEKKLRGDAAKGLEADEEVMKGLRSEFRTATDEQRRPKPGEGLEGEAKWKAEYASDAKLQAEFKSAGGEKAYIAAMKAEADGLVREFAPGRRH